MVKKAPKKDKKKFSFFLHLFHIFPRQLRKKTKPLTFSALLSPEIEKPQRKTSRTKFFFYSFFLTFLHPTAPRNRKNYHLPFFRNSDLKCSKMPLSALKFHILQITFFPPLFCGHIYLPKHTPFFLTKMLKNALNTFF